MREIHKMQEPKPKRKSPATPRNPLGRIKGSKNIKPPKDSVPLGLRWPSDVAEWIRANKQKTIAFVENELKKEEGI
jgi:hypothetical protein